MDRVLGPGMRLLRRLRVTLKFVVIALLLVVPLVMGMAGSFFASTDELRAVDGERRGLDYAAALVRLAVQIDLLRNTQTDGGDVGAVSVSAIDEVDAADRTQGDRLGVHDDWLGLRHRLMQLRGEAMSDGRQAQLAREATGACADLLGRVADESGLTVDSQLETYYLIVALVQNLPGLVEAGTQSHDRQQRVRMRTDEDASTQLIVILSDLDARNANLAVDIWKSANASGSRDLGPLADPLAVLQANARQLAENTEELPQDGSAAHEPAVHVLAASALDLVSVVEARLDDLLAQRRADLQARRLRPIALSMALVLVAVYLFLAMFRSTKQDLGSVLEDILQVTEGGIQSSDPLPGTDEFARMSRAVVYVRDRLTAAMGELSFVARHDELTSLGNRRLVLEKLADHLGGAAQHDPAHDAAAVALLDLDGFKDLNDSFGDAIGDQILLTVTRRLHRSTRRRDVVARVGGPQFAVVMLGVTSIEEVCQSLREVVASVEQPIPVGGRRLHVRVRTGVALGRPGEKTAEELLRDAEVAKSATRDGASRGQIEVFAPQMRQVHSDRVELSADLVQAIDQDELALYYQPVVDLATGSLHSVEALVRWVHPTRGLVGPDTFIPLAEATGLIEPLGRWVLREAAGQLARWSAEQAEGLPLLMDVNVSAAQLSEDSLVTDLLAVLDQTRLDPRLLVLEITESALMADVETAIRRLRELAAIGVAIALDDFGTGYSSLAYLRRLPVDIIKIDKSFVQQPPGGERQSAALVHSIVGLARTLGLQTIAEGIETPEHAEDLRAAGCHLGQGYLFGRPITAEEMTAALRRTRGGRLPWPVPAAAGGVPEQRPARLPLGAAEAPGQSPRASLGPSLESGR